MVERHLRKIVRQPCWGAFHHPRLNLSMNFGKPRLEFREPFASSSSFPKVRQAFAKRLVTVRGQW